MSGDGFLSLVEASPAFLYPAPGPMTRRRETRSQRSLVSALGWLRALHVHRRRTRPGPDDDEVALDITVVGLSMDDPCRHMDEVAGLGRDALPAAWARLHEEAAGRHEDGGLVVGVVMPSRADPGGGADETGPKALRRYGLFPDHAGGGIGLSPLGRPDVSDWC